VRPPLVAHTEANVPTFSVGDIRTVVYPLRLAKETVWYLSVFCEGDDQVDHWDTCGPFGTEQSAMIRAREKATEEWEESERLALEWGE
jgi:hypothetical protein